MIEILVPSRESTIESLDTTSPPPTDESAARQAEADYKLRMYYQWLDRERARAAIDPEVFAARCLEATRTAREQAAHTSYIHPDYHVPFHVPGSGTITPEEREAARSGIEEGIRSRRFAQPAIKAVFSEPHAVFIDTFLQYCHEVEPNEVVLASCYTPEGDLISIKSFSDPSDETVEPHHRVVIGDLHSLTVTEYRVNAIEQRPSTYNDSSSMRLVFTTDRFDTIDGQPAFDDAHPIEGLLALNEAVMQQHSRHQRQAYVELSGHSIIYKPFDGKERSAPPLDQMTYDRYALTRLAMAAGLTVSPPSTEAVNEGASVRSIA